MKRIVTLVAGLLIAGSVTALDLFLVLEAGAMERAAAPHIYGRSVLLSYEFDRTQGGERRVRDDHSRQDARDDSRIHTVQAAFAHENYSTLHPFQRNEYGVYVLIVDLPQDLTELRYRLIADGLWTTDPHNPSTAADRWGVHVSLLQVPPPGPPSEYPVVHGANMVEFRFLAKPGQQVAIVGSFNGWDPFMTPMIEMAPGDYRRTVRLPSGEHLYYFTVDGLRMPDPRNANQRWNTNGLIVSALRLP